MPKPQAHISVSGVPKLIRKVDAATADATIKKGLRAGMNVLRDELKRYPPAPAGSSYVRTRRLGNSWAQRTSGFAMKSEGFVGTIHDLAVVGQYARYVMDKELQAWMHKGRWHTVQSVADDKGKDVSDAISEEIEDAMKEQM